MTNEEYQSLRAVKSEIRDIILHHTNNISIEARNALKSYKNAHKLNYCDCVAGTFMLASKVQNEMLKYEAENKKI